MKTAPEDISNTELLAAINAGFNAIEERFQELEDRVDKSEKNLSHKIDSVSNRLDAEIIRRTDEQAKTNKRLTCLEDEVFEE